MKQRKHTTPTRAIDPRSLAQASGGQHQPQPWIVVGTGPALGLNTGQPW